MTREVEYAASHLFNSNEAPAPDPGETRRADPINAKSVNERADDVDVALAAIPFANSEDVDIVKQREANHPAEAVGQVQESQLASQPRTTSIATPRKRAKHIATQRITLSSKVRHEDLTAQIGTVDNRISADELVALEADNRRLKRLLAEQLSAQNLWLKKMLERFGAE